MLKVLIWTLILNFVLYFMMIQYWDRYLDSVSDMCNVDYNFSTSYKSYICIVIWCIFSFLGIPIFYYVYDTILKQSVLYFTLFITLLWMLWDIYPICMTDNGYKLEHVFINMFDVTYAGGIWILASLYLYHTFCKAISKSIPTIVVLFLLNLFIMLLFFYRWFIYNRKHTDTNWFVKLGDTLNWEKYSDYIILFKSNRKKKAF